MRYTQAILVGSDPNSAVHCAQPIAAPASRQAILYKKSACSPYAASAGSYQK